MSMTVYCQKLSKSVFGWFTDYSTSLTLNADSTFELRAEDPVFSYNFNSYKNKGVFTFDGNVVTLNPHLKKRVPEVSLIEKVIDGQDSIQVKFNYLLEEYTNDTVLVKKEPFKFDLLTLYFNKTYRHVVHARHTPICAFAPRVRKQAILDSSGTIKLPKQKIERLAVFSYGFYNNIELHPSIPNANYYEITIIQRIDSERMPRSKKVIIEDKYAYYYERRGEVQTSLTGLDRKW